VNPDVLVKNIDVALIAGSTFDSRSMMSSHLANVGFFGNVSIAAIILVLRVTTTFLAIQLDNHAMIFSAVSLRSELVTVVIPA